MKTNIFLVIFCLMNLIASSQNKVLKVHQFKDKKGSLLGEVYIRPLQGKKDVFDFLQIIKKTAEKPKTLYTIDKHEFTNGKKSGNDFEVLINGFYGYKLVLVKPDYIVLSYLRNNGKNVSDDITIEWNYSKKQFEVMKMP
jgi:hypothetical protein